MKEIMTKAKQMEAEEIIKLLLEVLNDYKARQVMAGSSRSRSLVPDPTPKKPLLVLGCETQGH